MYATDFDTVVIIHIVSCDRFYCIFNTKLLLNLRKNITYYIKISYHYVRTHSSQQPFIHIWFLLERPKSFEYDIWRHAKQEALLVSHYLRMTNQFRL